MLVTEDLGELEKRGEERYIYTILTYIVGVGETPQQEDLLQAIKQLESVNEEKLMTLADYLKPDVFKRGIEKGRKERDEEIAKAMLTKGIDVNTIASVTGYSKEELKKLIN